MTVRMELAAAFHHSWGGGLGMNVGLRAQKTASAGPAENFELSSDDGRPAGGGAAGGLAGAAAAGKGQAAHRGRVRDRPESRGPCAADGRTAARCPPVLRFFPAGSCQAGYRSAEDFPGQVPAALGGSSAPAADGGTVGACADCRILFFAPAAYCRADRRHSSFGWRRGRGSLQGSRARPRPNRAAYSGAHSRAEDRFPILLGEVFQNFSQVRVPQRPHQVCMMAQMMEFKGFFRTFLRHKKSPKAPASLGSEGARQCQLLHAAGCPDQTLGMGHCPLW